MKTFNGSSPAIRSSAAEARGSFTQKLTIVWTLATLLLLASHAQAHVTSGEAGGFVSGLAHPWSGLDHICAMVAVGLWGAQLGLPGVWVLPVTFPMIMAFGGFLGLIGFRLPGVEYGIAASAILLGAMVLFAARPPLPVAMILVGIFGLFHGHAHGHELPPGENALLYSIGFVIATGILHVLGITIGVVHRWNVGKAFLRFSGAAIAVAGIVFLIQAFHHDSADTGTKPATGASVPALVSASNHMG